MQTRGTRSLATREWIIEVAAHEFAHKGYAGTTHTEMLKLLGKSTPNFITYHFPAKSDIAHAVLHYHHQLITDCLDWLKRVHITGLANLVTLTLIVTTDEPHLEIFQAAMALEDDRTAPDAGEYQPCVRWLSVVNQQLELARNAGEISAEVVAGNQAWHLISLLYGTYQLADRLKVLNELTYRLEQAWMEILTSLSIEEPGTMIAEAKKHARDYLSFRDTKPALT